MSELYQNRHYRLGWKLLIFQNLIILLFPLLTTPVVSSEIFRFANNFLVIQSKNTIFDYLFTFTLILDLFAVFLISKGSFNYFLSLKTTQGKRDFRSRSFYVPLTGFLWVTFSFLWRLPFYLMGGFNLSLFVGFEPNQTYTDLLGDPMLYLYLILGSISLFLFLYFQDQDFMETFDLVEMTSDLVHFEFGRSTILGAVNLVGVFFLFRGSTLTSQGVESMRLYGTNPNGLLFFIGLLFKIIIVPSLAIWTSSKFLSSNKLKLKLQNPENSKIMKSVS